MKNIFFSLCCIGSFVITSANNYKTTHHVNKPIIDVVAQPGIIYTHTAPAIATNTPLLTTQLLYNEPVQVLKHDKEWSLVRLPYQSSRNPLHRLTGWVITSDLTLASSTPKNRTPLACTSLWTPAYTHTYKSSQDLYQLVTAFSFGTHLNGIRTSQSWWIVELLDGTEVYVPAPSVEIITSYAKDTIRSLIITRARHMLGMPYCWGGCSAFNPFEHAKLTGFDCSGLIYRLYDTCGIIVPRNSRSQFQAGTPIPASDIKAGDLVFLARPEETPLLDRIVHVMLYTGAETLIEAYAFKTPDGFIPQPIREVSFEERLGVPRSQLINGNQYTEHKYEVWCASLLEK